MCVLNNKATKWLCIYNFLTARILSTIHQQLESVTETIQHHKDKALALL